MDLSGNKVAKKKRVMSDAQREGLKKGLEALKAKREAMAKAKEEAKAKLSKPIAELIPKPTEPQPIQPIQPINDQSPAVNPLVAQIRKRNRIPKVDITDFAKFKEDVIQNLSQIKNTPQHVAQEKVVEKQVYLTGSDLLNKIFNFNS